jgi:hypothetical protein
MRGIRNDYVFVSRNTGSCLTETKKGQNRSDVRVTMRYVRSVEETKRAAVEAIKLSSRKSVHKLATNEIRPPVLAAVND